MPSRFASRGDYSQTFQSAYQNSAASYEARAQRVDAAREAEQSAKDALVFTKWQEGKISGNQLMQHIRTRQNQTYYDRAQQLQWKEAAIKYGDVIADEQAEAEYARTQNISALIAHYAGRAKGAKNGTPEARELATRLRTLRDQRMNDNLRKQARKIARAVERGDMSTTDLIKFYKDQLPSLRGDLKEQVLDTLAELRSKRKDENFAVAMAKIDNELATGQLSPQDAANQKKSVLDKFGTEKSDPVGYQTWLEQIRQLKATPDPAEVERLDFDLAAENITHEQYIAQINTWADQIAPYDLQASWELRGVAQDVIREYATPLDDPSILGNEAPGPGGGSRGYSGTVEVVKRLRGNAIKFITQFDGSRFSSTNCAMASGAMLAHMMGYQGLSGADVRSLSGDTSGGTNIFQVAAALEKAGVKGGSLDARSNVGWNEFMKKVQSGAPAVLSGWTGDIPQQFNSTSGIMGHSVSVAGYDKGRDAFLVLDPSGEKMWWPSSVVQDFGWGGQFNGLVLFAPNKTLDPKTLDRVGGKVKHISVNAPPMREGSQPMTQFDPGVRAAGELEKMYKKQMRKQRTRLRDGGVDAETRENLTTRQAVEKLIDERADDIGALQAQMDGIVKAVEDSGEYTGGEVIMPGGDVYTENDIRAIQKQLIYQYDAQQVLYKGAGNNAKAEEQTTLKEGVLVGASMLNSLEALYLTNTQVQEAKKVLDGMGDATSPEEYARKVQSLLDRLEVIGTLNDNAETNANPSIEGRAKTDAREQASKVGDIRVPGVEEELGDWDKLLETLDNDDPEAFIDAWDQVMMEMDFSQTDDGLAFLDAVKGTYAEQLAVDNGLATMILLPDPETGQHRLSVLPMAPTMRPDETGQMQEVMIPDVSVLGEDMVNQLAAMGYDGSNLPTTQMPGAAGVNRVPVIPVVKPYGGVRFAVWGDITKEQAADIRDRFGLTDEMFSALVNANTPLSEDALAVIASDPNALEYYRNAGVISNQPFPTEQINWNGEIWYKDQGTTPEGTQGTWFKDNLPYVGRTPEKLEGLEALLGQYYGAEFADNGKLWIDYQPDEYDPTAATGEFVINLGVPSDMARKDLQENGGLPPTVYARDPENPGGPLTPITPADTRHPLHPSTKSLNQYITDLNAKKKMVQDKLLTVLDPAEAADLPLMGWPGIAEIAKREQLNPDTAEWEFEEVDAVNSPMTKIREDLNISYGASQDEAKGQLQALPTVDSIRDKAMGVAKANQMAREKARAAADEAKLAAARATSIPRITPGGSAPKLPGAGSTPNLPGAGTGSRNTKPPSSIPAFPGADYKPKPTSRPGQPPIQTSGNNPDGSRFL